MVVPIPSFFKIRLLVIIVGLLLVFFVLGLVKNVFAYDCLSVSNYVYAYTSGFGTGSGIVDNVAIDSVTGEITYDVVYGEYTKLNTDFTIYGWNGDCDCWEYADSWNSYQGIKVASAYDFADQVNSLPDKDNVPNGCVTSYEPSYGPRNLGPPDNCPE